MKLQFDFMNTLKSRTRNSTPCGVGPSVGRSVRPNPKLRVVFALQLLPNRPRLSYCVSGLVFTNLAAFTVCSVMKEVNTLIITFKGQL